jgi:hypothetical protein
MMKQAERIASPPVIHVTICSEKFVSFEAHVNAADTNPGSG